MMRWPWSRPADDSHRDWTSTLLEPTTLIPSLALTASALVGVRFYKSYLRRIPSVNHIKPDYFRRRTLFGRVTSVGDADNFRLFHTPGGRLAGWGWLPWKTVPTRRDELRDQTIHIRIAGVDAPELAHWGREAQPFSKEALEMLTALINGQRVRARIYRRDQYDRVVAQVYVRRWFVRKDVGLEMLKQGFATVYEAKMGAEFGKSEQQYRDAEKTARGRKVGMWAQPNFIQKMAGAKKTTLESPREYKTRHAAADKKKK